MSQSRLANLDALRGIAALCVVVQHAIEKSAALQPAFWPLLETINLGRFGVLLFFLISGFVIPPSIARHGLKGFAINRAFRLLPALWVSVACMMAIFAFEDRVVAPQVVAANLTMTARTFGLIQLSPVYWTLTYELYFYLACAVLVALGLLRCAPLLALLALAFALGGFVAQGDMKAVPAYFAAGMLAQLVFSGERGARAWLALALGGIVLSSMLFAMHLSGARLLGPVAIPMSFLLPIPLFLAAIMAPPSVPRWALWLGSISYSVYLFQDVALWALEGMASTRAGATVYPLAAAALAVGLGAVVFRWVERPGMAAGKVLEQRLGLRRATQATALAA